MSEILFRGKRVDNGEWVAGMYDYNPFFEETTIHNYQKECMVYSVVPETVGQYTGLTDKNGKKIFEGDIHKFNQKYYVIKYGVFHNWSADEDSFGWYMCDKNGNSEECLSGDEKRYCNIVGNIHDNPELLGGDGE